jgi:hypothetical protein
VDGVTTNFTLDLQPGLAQVLTDGHPGSPAEHEYLYGLGRIAQYDDAVSTSESDVHKSPVQNVHFFAIEMSSVTI